MFTVELYVGIRRAVRVDRLSRRRRDCPQKTFCRRFVAKSHLKTALIINDPPSLNQALCLLECFEPMDIAAQGRSITDAVRAIGGRSGSAPARPATSATCPANTACKFPPFVADLAVTAEKCRRVTWRMSFSTGPSGFLALEYQGLILVPSS